MSPNKGMKLTRLGGGESGVGALQLIPGVRRTDGSPGGGGSVLLSAAMTAALLLRGAHSGSPEQGLAAGADVEAAQVVWSYDTGG